ncbi:MAG: hypothetical protein K2W82_03560 [Candidatus Obscuribacterales bacterium]|nr:hypothetical protein [Candidatus Obscuribacterales bacterium]
MIYRHNPFEEHNAQTSQTHQQRFDVAIIGIVVTIICISGIFSPSGTDDKKSVGSTNVER